MSGRVFIPAIHVFPADNGTSREWPAFAGHDDTGEGHWRTLLALVTVLGIWIWRHALHALPARIAASAQYVQPLICVLASAAIFGTPLGGGFALGSALVLGGIALCSLSGPHRH